MEDKERASEQKGNAESLQRQIDEIMSGEATTSRKKSLREFIAEKMAEDEKPKEG